MKPIHTRNRTIGLLGGSFNPAHAGHLHISRYALDALGFSEIWWLVSPQNPLKSKKGMADYAARLESARHIARSERRIKVLALEARENLTYSYQTVNWLQSHYPAAHFVWLMGSDNLRIFHRWRRWQRIMQQLPIMVFDRAPYSHTALRSKTALFARHNALSALKIIHLPKNPLSSTELRKTLGKDAFLRHNKG